MVSKGEFFWAVVILAVSVWVFCALPVLGALQNVFRDVLQDSMRSVLQAEAVTGDDPAPTSATTLTYNGVALFYNGKELIR